MRNSTKKLVCLLLTAVIMVSLGSVFAFADGETEITVESQTCAAGSAVTVPVTITDNSGFAAFGLKVTYDPALTVSEISTEGCLCDGLTVNTGASGVIYLAYAGTENITGDGALFSIVFTGAEAGETYAISIEEGAANGAGSFKTLSGTVYTELNPSFTAGTITGAAAGFAVTVNDLTNGNATISGLTSGESYNGGTSFNVACSKACIVLFSADGGATYTRLAATANAEGGYDFTANVTGEAVITVVVKGDVNMDGSVNASDATLIVRSLLADTNSRAYSLTAIQSVIADVDGSGSINASDRTAITRSVLATTNSRYAMLAW